MKKKIIPLEEAEEKELKKYFTGYKCPYGHLAERYTCNSRCCVCASLASKRLRKENKHRYRKAHKIWVIKNRERVNEIAIRHYHRNKKKIQKRHREWLKINKEQQIKYRKDYRRRNLEARRKASREWNWNNQERLKRKRKIWKKKNRDKCIASFNKYRATLTKAKGKFSYKVISEMYKKQKGRCAYCIKRMTGTKNRVIDHKTPLSRGGSNYSRNLHLTCRSCNSSKRDKTHKEFLVYRRKHLKL